MGVRVLASDSKAVLYCSTSMWAFGPVFYATDDKSAEESAREFLTWLRVDPRLLPDRELEERYWTWTDRDIHEEEA